MADKLGLGPEVRPLNIGSSFYSNKTAFHTLRYDFKPASVVSGGSKAASLEMGGNNEVTVTHCDASTGSQAVFKGSRKDYSKECVLIIDRTTGQITLEKLNTNILLKKTRAEGSRPPQIYSGRPPTPVESKKSSPPGSSRGSTPGGGGRAATLTTSSRHSPRQVVSSPQYNHRASPLIVHKSPPQLSNLNLSPSPAASLPMIDDCNDSSSNSFDIGNPLTLPDLRNSPDFNSFHEDDGLAGGGNSTGVGVLSDTSSDSDSDSNSSGSESDPPPQTNNSNHRINGHVNGKNSSNPKHFLQEDLQLSESGSDTE